MERKDFIRIIKLRSFWNIDRRKGDYRLPSGEKLSNYVRNLVTSQMELDSLGILSDGNLCAMYGGKWDEDLKYFSNYILYPPFKYNEVCTYDEMNIRVNHLISEIVG